MAYQNFYTTKLYTDVSAADTTITLETPPTATSGRLVLEARNVSKREVIKYTGVSGNQVTGALRGQGGTTAQTHLANTLVEMNLTAEDLEDAINVPNDVVTRFDESLGDFIASGLVWSQTALLVGEMTAGVVYIDGERLVIGALSGINFTASKDTYVDVGVDGVVDYDPVANGASAPALAGSHVRIAKVVTNGSGITSVVQTGVDSLGNTIRPSGSVGPTQLSTSANLLAITNITSTYNTGNTAATTVLPGTSTTVTVPSGGRSVKVSFNCYDITNASAPVSALTMYIRAAGTNIGGYRWRSWSGGAGTGASFWAIHTPAAGSVTYDLTFAKEVAGHGVALAASATSPIQLLVELV